MPFKPSVLILEKSSFPAHIALEECERLEKTEDQKDAIVRFQRPKATGNFEKFVRFFTDLLHGVTKANGELLNRPDIPSVVNVRGISYESKFINETDTKKCFLSPQSRDSNKRNIEFSQLVVDTRDDLEIKNLRQKKLFRSTKRQLKDRFDAHGRTADKAALNTFLELAESGKLPQTFEEIRLLQQFSDVLSKKEKRTFTELTEEAKECVKTTLRDAQEKIRKTTTSIYTDTSLIPNLTFSLLTEPNEAGPIKFRPPPSDPPPPRPENISPATSSEYGAVQTPPDSITRPFNSSSSVSGALPPAKPLTTIPAPVTPTSPPAQPAPPVPPAPPAPPPPPPPTPPINAPEIITKVADPPAVRSATLDAGELIAARARQRPTTASEQGEAARSALQSAGSSNVPDANELTLARVRLKSVQTNATPAKTPPASDNSLGSILQQAMVTRRGDLNPEEEKPNIDDEDWQ